MTHAVIHYFQRRIEAAIQERQASLENSDTDLLAQQTWWSKGASAVLEKQISDLSTKIEQVDAKRRSHAQLEVLQRDLPDGNAACLTVEQVNPQLRTNLSVDMLCI